MSLIYEFQGSKDREVVNAGYIKAFWISKGVDPKEQDPAKKNRIWFILTYILSPNDFTSWVWFDTEKKANQALDDLKNLMMRAERGLI